GRRRQVLLSTVGEDLPRKALAEFIGTAFLLIAVIGSGIAAQRPSPNDTGLQLFENAAATAAALVAMILAVGPVSGAHLNPVATPAVTLARSLSNTFAGIDPASAPGFVAFQLVGAALAIGAIRVLYPSVRQVAPAVVVPHEEAAL